MITLCILSFIYSCALNVSLKTRCYNWLHVAIDGVTSTYHLFALQYMNATRICSL